MCSLATFFLLAPVQQRSCSQQPPISAAPPLNQHDGQCVQRIHHAAQQQRSEHKATAAGHGPAIGDIGRRRCWYRATAARTGRRVRRFYVPPVAAATTRAWPGDYNRLYTCKTTDEKYSFLRGYANHHRLHHILSREKRKMQLCDRLKMLCIFMYICLTNGVCMPHIIMIRTKTERDIQWMV